MAKQGWKPQWVGTCMVPRGSCWNCPRIVRACILDCFHGMCQFIGISSFLFIQSTLTPPSFYHFQLVERQLHRNLLYKVMPRRAIMKLQRGQTVLEKFNLVTIFFSDIVGFTNMAGNMRPIQVMKVSLRKFTYMRYRRCCPHLLIHPFLLF